MAKAIVDTLDGLPADLKSEYRPGTKAEGLEGKFVLKVDEVDGWALDHIAPLKNSLSNAKQERDAAKKILKSLGDDFSLEQYQQAMSELETLRKGASSEAVQKQIDSVKAQLNTKHEQAIKERDGIIAQRDTEIDELLITASAETAFAELEALPGMSKILMPHVRSTSRVIRDANGKPTAVILQEDGKTPRLSMQQGNQGNMNIREFVERLKKTPEYAPLFKGSGAQGTGSGKKPPTGSSGSQNGNSDHKPTIGQRQPGLDKVEQLRQERLASTGGSA